MFAEALHLPTPARLRARRDRRAERNEFGLTRDEEAARAADYGASAAAKPTAEQMKQYRLMGARMRAAG